jgi:hypothetical protein
MAMQVTITHAEQEFERPLRINTHAQPHSRVLIHQGNLEASTVVTKALEAWAIADFDRSPRNRARDEIELSKAQFYGLSKTYATTYESI